jgi:hypothetical protein
MLLDIFKRIAHAGDFFRIFIRDLNVEFFFKTS